MHSSHPLAVVGLLALSSCATVPATPAPRPSAPATDAQPAVPGRVYDIGEVTVKPELINRATVARALEQNYPPLLRDAGAAGTVHVRMIIGADGRTSSILVTRSTDPSFNAAAMAVMRVMRFNPAKVDGVAVPIRAELPVTFSPSR
jgi:TonB family protein